MSAVGDNEARTYGNWRKPGGGGLFGLGKFATYGGLGYAGLSMMVMIATGPVVGFLMLFIGIAAIAAASVPLMHDRSLVQTVTPRIAYLVDSATGRTRHRGGPLTLRGTFALPGLAATSQLDESVDAQGRPYAIVTLPRRHHHTIVFSAFPDGDGLVDDDDIDTWVARWGVWLAALGDEPGLIAVSATIETSPDSGQRLRRELATTTSDDAPEITRRMVGEIGESYPVGSANVTAMIAITFRSVRGQYREDAIRDLAGRVAHFSAELHGTGAGSARPMSAQELCERIRIAYDPGAQEAFDDARARGEQAKISWGDVGPAHAEAHYGCYRHDDAVSVTWAMTGAPRGNVPSDVLSRLLRPHPDVARKRVTLLYRPIDSARASRIVNADARDAEATVRNSKRPTERMKAERDSAQQAAREEAKGAGVTNFGMLITATADDVDQLPAVRRVIRQLAPTAKLRIRPVYASQEAAFTAGLPLGVVLPAHTPKGRTIDSEALREGRGEL
jgi:hypothetical protein